MSACKTIAAIATAVGRGGVGIVRVSGPQVKIIATAILGKVPSARYAHYGEFKNQRQELLDIGLAFYYPGPHSFTGEDVLELHAHGGMWVLDGILSACLELGAELAQPGEFTQRAFLNDKIDLAQAEAIADLIDSSSTLAAKSALLSLQGEFSSTINSFVKDLIQLRLFVEAAIDFPEEEIDFLSDGKIESQLKALMARLATVFESAEQGALLREGMQVVIAGHPNAGKSTLLNQLSGKDAAIVTDIPGTTRDVMREHIVIDGLPLHIIDTAGIRETTDSVEKEGVRRAWGEIEKADIVLLLMDIDDVGDFKRILEDFKSNLPENIDVLVLINKIDKQQLEPKVGNIQQTPCIYLSAKHNLGLTLLKQTLKEKMGFKNSNEGCFLARRRHIECLNSAKKALDIGLEQLQVFNAGELLAEELRQAQHALSQITGEFTSDDLLGEIFSSFCIGK